MRRGLALAAGVLFLAWLAYGLSLRVGGGGRGPAAPGELRGAWHVHTSASDGRATLEEVARAARAEGLEFLVVTDHDRRVPDAPAYVEGVLVVPASEASTRLGHVVALGAPRALGPAERGGDPLAAIAALGGEAVLAHPLHPERPYRGDAAAPWRGLEVVSNDTAWYDLLSRRDVGRFLSALAKLPFAGGRAILALADDPSDELALLDGALAASPAREDGRPPRLLFCSADAHGWPSYRAAFEAFSMRVPVAATGDAARDAAAVTAALLDGSAWCVLDALAPARGVALTARPGGRLLLRLPGADVREAEAVLVRAGGAPRRLPLTGDETPLCDPACAPGWYRAEVHLGKRRWIFTNPVRVE